MVDDGKFVKKLGFVSSNNKKPYPDGLQGIISVFFVILYGISILSNLGCLVIPLFFVLSFSI